MKLFLTGATGYIGSAVAEALQAAGHAVTGLARNQEAEQTLKARGITPAGGDLQAPHSLASALEGSDGVIHAGSSRDGRADGDAVQTMLDALKDSGKPFVCTSGVWVLGNTGDNPGQEDSPVNPPPLAAWLPGVEQAVLKAAGVRGMVIRPGVVYGRGAGIPGMFVQSAAQSGAARYIGDGQNRWATVDVEDLAELYLRVFERGKAGGIYHGVDGRPLRVKEIAEAASFSADAGGRVESWTPEEAGKMLGPALVEAFLMDQVVSAAKTRRELGWEPRAVSLLEDLRYGSYAMARINP